MIELEQARHRLEELGLAQAAQSPDAILEAASRGQSTDLSFLNELLEAEFQERQRRNVEVRMKLAHLPYRHTLREFDFAFQPGIDDRLIRELASLAFIGRQENVLLDCRSISFRWPNRWRFAEGVRGEPAGQADEGVPETASSCGG